MGPATKDMSQILNRRQRRPTHPGALLREDVLPHLGMTQTELAQRLGVARQTVNEIVSEKRAVSMDMAYRLGRLLRMDPSTWIRMQEAVDVWDTIQANHRVYETIIPINRERSVRPARD